MEGLDTIELPQAQQRNAELRQVLAPAPGLDGTSAAVDPSLDWVGLVHRELADIAAELAVGFEDPQRPTPQHVTVHHRRAARGIKAAALRLAGGYQDAAVPAGHQLWVIGSQLDEEYVVRCAGVGALRRAAATAERGMHMIAPQLHSRLDRPGPYVLARLAVGAAWLG